MKSFCLLACLVLVLTSCDTAIDKPPAQVVVSLSPYDEAVLLDSTAAPTPFARLSIDQELAVPLSRFPSQRFRISAKGYGSSTEQLVDEDLTATVYLLQVPESPYWPSLGSPNPFLRPTAEKHSSTPEDSVNLTVYAIIVQRQELTYPEEIVVDFSVDDTAARFVLDPSQHTISLDEQLVRHGADFDLLPETPGLIIQMNGDLIDASIFPGLIAQRTVVWRTDGTTFPGIMEIIGRAFTDEAGLYDSYGTVGAIQQQVLPESEFRLFLLRRD
ncbi:MAG: hypothetical protein SH809_05820 [Rhodothermales bacterium]|nr:hypothetical protein [Rhodothermales bacterium]